MNYCANNMWNWAFHVRHNCLANLPREEIKKVETPWQKQSERKGKVPKSYEKICNNKRRKVLEKESAVSFYILKKTVKKKVGIFWQMRAQFPFEDSVSKARKSMKLSGIKATTIWLRRVHLLNLMDNLERETSPHGPTFEFGQRGCLCG